jgi:hypothetical protein
MYPESAACLRLDSRDAIVSHDNSPINSQESGSQVPLDVTRK